MYARAKPGYGLDRPGEGDLGRVPPREAIEPLSIEEGAEGLDRLGCERAEADIRQRLVGAPHILEQGEGQAVHQSEKAVRRAVDLSMRQGLPAYRPKLGIEPHALARLHHAARENGARADVATYLQRGGEIRARRVHATPPAQDCPRIDRSHPTDGVQVASQEIHHALAHHLDLAARRAERDYRDDLRPRCDDAGGVRPQQDRHDPRDQEACASDERGPAPPARSGPRGGGLEARSRCERLGERLRESGHAGESVLGFAGEAAAHGRLERCRHRRARQPEGRARCSEAACDDRLRCGAGERRLPTQHLVDYAGQRVLVGSGVHIAGGSLLGTHVLGRTDRQSGFGQPLAAPSERTRDAEVGHQRITVLSEQQILRLDVAMKDAVRMGVL